MLNLSVQTDITVQAGTPMTVTGEVFLSQLGAGGTDCLFIRSKISSGGPGGEAPPGLSARARGQA